ncbi:MAG: hypothetical protein R3D66_05055 [Alphaproteobacteria bacterium]
MRVDKQFSNKAAKHRNDPCDQYSGKNLVKFEVVHGTTFTFLGSFKDSCRFRLPHREEVRGMNDLSTVIYSLPYSRSTKKLKNVELMTENSKLIAFQVRVEPIPI